MASAWRWSTASWRPPTRSRRCAYAGRQFSATDVSRHGLPHEFTGRIAPELLAKGVDGVFLDNVDMIETRNHAAQRPGMGKLVLELADLAHGQGRLLFTQNGHWGLEKLRLIDAIDGWNREDVTWTYDFDRKRYVHQRRRAPRAALAAALPYVSDIGLTARVLPNPPLTCSYSRLH